MTRDLSIPSWVKAGAGAAGVAGLLGIWNFLAGIILLIGLKVPVEQAGFATLYQYWFHYRENPLVAKWLSQSLGVAGCMVLVLLVPIVAKVMQGRQQALHGEARFATPREVKNKAKLLGNKGIIVGKYKGRYMLFDGLQHLMIAAPTRSGKGVGIVIPNLLNWPESMVVLDIKQENWDITSGFRARNGQAVFLFAPGSTDYKTHRWNPFDYVSNDPLMRIDDLMQIATMLIPDNPKTDQIWIAEPRNLFVGLALMLFETPGKPRTMGQMVRELNTGEAHDRLAKIVKERDVTDNPLSPQCKRMLNGFLAQKAPETYSGIQTGLNTALSLFANPLVDAATGSSDFDLRELRKKRMTIYLGITPDNLGKMAPLIRLFFQQALDQNLKTLPQKDPSIKYKCVFLMDEFTAMGAIPVLAKGISFIAGYWLRMMPIIQSPAQITETYGRECATTFITNHALQIVYPPKASETQTLEDVSKWLGFNTVKSASTSRAKGLFSRPGENESVSDQRRALMLPQEISALPASQELVVVEGSRPILAEKVVYHADPVFYGRLKSVSPTLAAINGAPTQGDLEKAIQRGELAARCQLIDIARYAAETEKAHAEAEARRTGQGGDEQSAQPLSPETVVPVVPTPDLLPELAATPLSSFAIDLSGILRGGVADASVSEALRVAKKFCELSEQQAALAA